MDELAQDLASALEESELKQDIDDIGEMSASSLRQDRELYRKRKTRKRRTLSSTNSHIVSSLLNNLVVVKQINYSPGSSSSLDEAVKDYVESLTANCSDESEEYVNSLKSRLKNAMLSNNLHDRGHSRRVFKQATPCCCESDSFTENGSSHPVFRRHKKKKRKRMTMNSNHMEGKLETDGKGHTEDLKKKVQTTSDLFTDLPEENGNKMLYKTTKSRKQKMIIACLLCSQKSCSRLQTDIFVVNSHVSNNSEVQLIPKDPNVTHKDESGELCPCRCHSASLKDESSISSTSSNSDTDSANFTQDDIGGDGDDEMTDFYAESENGPVWGVPDICSHLWWTQRHAVRNSKDEAVFLHKVNEPDSNSVSPLYDPKGKRFVNGFWHATESSRRGFHARNNRLPGMAARSIRRGRRRTKMKKSTKDKTARDQELYDFHSSLSKLSLSARSKRRKIEEKYWKENLTNKADASSSHVFHPLPNILQNSNQSDDVHNHIDMSIDDSNTHVVEGLAGTSSSTPTNTRENENTG